MLNCCFQPNLILTNLPKVCGLDTKTFWVWWWWDVSGDGLGELYKLAPCYSQLPPSTPTKLSYGLQLSLEDFPSVQQAVLPC